jgi:hypothetical protein
VGRFLHDWPEQSACLRRKFASVPTLSENQHKILLTASDYAQRLNLDYRALSAAAQRGAIQPAGQLPSGRCVTERRTLNSELFLAAEPAAASTARE